MFAVSKNMRMFVVPNSESHTGSRITYESAILKRGSLSDDSTSVGSRCLAKHKGDSASFVIHTTNFFQKMPNSEKVSGAAKNSTRTASIERYSTLKSQEKDYKVVVFSGVLVQGQGFGHSISYVISARNEAQAINQAIRKYRKRPNALEILEVRVVRAADSQCLTCIRDAK